MSLTSYRAAPPRDKPLRALSKSRCGKRLRSTPKGAVSVPRLPEKATPGTGRLGFAGRYVPTPARFGKGRKATFLVFMTAKIDRLALSERHRRPSGALAKGSIRAQPWRSKTEQKGGNDGKRGLRRHRRRLRRVRGRQPVVRGSGHLGGAARGRRQGR